MKTLTSLEARTTDDYDAAVINEGLLFVTVCHRREIDPQHAIDHACFPAGTTGGWQFVERADLPEVWWEGDGARTASPTDDPHDAPYPQPCAHHPETHVHSVGAC